MGTDLFPSCLSIFILNRFIDRCSLKRPPPRVHKHKRPCEKKDERARQRDSSVQRWIVLHRATSKSVLEYIPSASIEIDIHRHVPDTHSQQYTAVEPVVLSHPSVFFVNDVYPMILSAESHLYK
jgi:hypothetical protein